MIKALQDDAQLGFVNAYFRVSPSGTRGKQASASSAKAARLSRQAQALEQQTMAQALREQYTYQQAMNVRSRSRGSFSKKLKPRGSQSSSSGNSVKVKAKSQRRARSATPSRAGRSGGKSSDTKPMSRESLHQFAPSPLKYADWGAGSLRMLCGQNFVGSAVKYARINPFDDELLRTRTLRPMCTPSSAAAAL